jgi:hypothetical protein
MLQRLSLNAVFSRYQPAPGELWAQMRSSVFLLTHQYQGAGLAKTLVAIRHKEVLNNSFLSLVLYAESTCQAAMVNVLYLYTVFM